MDMAAMTPFTKENLHYYHVSPTDTAASVTSLPCLTQQQNLFLPLSATTFVAFLIFIDNLSKLLNNLSYIHHFVGIFEKKPTFIP